MYVEFHWLDVPEQVKFKLVSMVHNCLQASSQGFSVLDGLLIRYDPISEVHGQSTASSFCQAFAWSASVVTS